MWGLLPIFWKSLSMLDPLYIMAVRVIFSALFGYVVIAVKGKEGILRDALCRPKEMIRLAWASLLITLSWWLYVVAVNTGHILEAGLGFFMMPTMCLAASAFLLKEKMNRWETVSAVIAASGVMAALFLYGAVPWMALLMCVVFGAYGVIKKTVSCDGDVSVFIESLYMTAPALLYVFWAEGEGAGAIGVLSGWEWLLLPMTGVVTAFPLILFAAGMQGISFTAASVLMYLDPLIETSVGFLYGEMPSLMMSVNFGFALVSVGFCIAGTIARNAAIHRDLRRRLADRKNVTGKEA